MFCWYRIFLFFDVLNEKSRLHTIAFSQLIDILFEHINQIEIEHVVSNIRVDHLVFLSRFRHRFSECSNIRKANIHRIFRKIWLTVLDNEKLFNEKINDENFIFDLNINLSDKFIMTISIFEFTNTRTTTQIATIIVFDWILNSSNSILQRSTSFAIFKFANWTHEFISIVFSTKSFQNMSIVSILNVLTSLLSNFSQFTIIVSITTISNNVDWNHSKLKENTNWKFTNWNNTNLFLNYRDDSANDTMWFHRMSKMIIAFIFKFWHYNNVIHHESIIRVKFITHVVSTELSKSIKSSIAISQFKNSTNNNLVKRFSEFCTKFICLLIVHLD